MTNRFITQMLGIIVSLVGTVVIVGWFLDIAVLKSLLPEWVTMKFSTALSFVFSGFIVATAYQAIAKESTARQITLLFSAFIILLVMSSLLFSSIFGVSTGVEDFLIKEYKDTVKSTVAGRPSIATIINFLLIAWAALVILARSQNIHRIVQRLGSVILVIGTIGVIGYITNIPILYYYHPVYSTAMAFHTAILFIFIGIGLILAGKPPVNNSTPKATLIPPNGKKLLSKLTWK